MTFAALCEKVRADPLEVLRGMGLDKRVAIDLQLLDPAGGGSLLSQRCESFDDDF